MTSNLLNIKKFGQKIWLDNLSRDLLKSGTLAKLIQNDGIAGVTSNPTIFHKAISSDPLYQADLAQAKQQNLTLEERYESLVIPDIQEACDIFANLFHSSNGEDGYVSIEVSPELAHDKENTVTHAKRLWAKINKPNLMIKIPATKEGIAAFEELTSLGISVNITLLFSLDQVIDTWQAYIQGLRKRHQQKLPLNHIKAVASFFISRVDSAVDHKLPKHLQGKTAINLAKTAYLVYNEVFATNNPANENIWQELKLAGAREQYLLFASTGTKNPNYSDVLYVEELIGKQTINTLPDATLNAFRDHGLAGNGIINGLENAPNIIEEIKQAGIDMQQLGETLLNEGLKSFATSFDSLLALMK